MLIAAWSDGQVGHRRYSGYSSEALCLVPSVLALLLSMWPIIVAGWWVVVSFAATGRRRCLWIVSGEWGRDVAYNLLG